MGSRFPQIVSAFVTGLVFGSWVRLSFWISWGAPVVFLLVLACGRRARRGLATALALLLFAWLGALHSQRIHPRSLPENHIVRYVGSKQADVEGMIVSTPEIREDRVRLLVEVKRVFHGRSAEPARGRLLVTVAEGGGALLYGDRIRLRCRLRRPRPAANPGEFDWRRYLALRGILATAFVKDSRQILLIRHHRGAWPRMQVEGLRGTLAASIRRELPEPARGVLLAVALGERWAVPRSTREAFAALGVSHLLAISGLHMGLLAWMASVLLRWLILRSNWLALRIQADKWSWAFSLPLLLGYAAIAGMGTSTLRALIMISALACAMMLDRSRDFLHAVALAALVILVIHPAAVHELSFQLSFAAVLGILCAVSVRTRLLPREKPAGDQNRDGRLTARLFRGSLLLGVSSLAAMLATLPLILIHFHRVPTGSLPANLILVPLTGFVVLPLALGGLMGLIVWPQAGIQLLWICAWVLDWMVRGIRLAGGWFGEGLFLPTPRPHEIILYYVILVGLCHIRRNRWVRWATLCLLVFLGGLWAAEAISRSMDKDLQVHFLSVGNGVSVLVEGPRGSRMLVDGGGLYDDRADIGAMRVAPVLWERRIMNLDDVVLSHPHPDHMNGLRFVLAHFGVGRLWENGDRPQTRAYQSFQSTVLARGLSSGILSRGMAWHLGDALVEVLHPPEIQGDYLGKATATRRNNRSAVLRISLGKVSFLLPGDIESGAEAWLLAHGLGHSTVVLAPHHGSRSSSTGAFIEAVSPRFVVFSSASGAADLVDAAVRERYLRRTVGVYHTGLDGMVSFLTDGNRLRVRTYLSEKEEAFFPERSDGSIRSPAAPRDRGLRVPSPMRPSTQSR